MPFPQDIFPDNAEAQNAFNLAEYTNQCLLITGKAGTGKSTFLKHFCRVTHKKRLVLAPTGIAALNVGGQTLHSFFGFPWRTMRLNDNGIPYFPTAKYNEYGSIEDDEHPKRKLIRNVDVIIIDEVSMVRADVVDAIDNSLRKNGGNPQLPFGGKQIVFIGDLFQLEPVVKKDNDMHVISQSYASPFFFSANVFDHLSFSNIEFVKVYRQSDAGFIGLLNKIRNASADSNDLLTLNKRCIPEYQPSPDQYFIILTPTNAKAKEENSTHLENLAAQAFTYTGQVKDKFDEKDFPTSLHLILKAGAQVMFVKNDAAKRWVNGTIGKVSELHEDRIKVKIKQGNHEFEYNVEQAEWENTEYTWNNDSDEIKSEVIGTFTQYPLKLAWAITIHKSQGLTFEQAIINSGTGMFAHGQCYVALSRCTSFEGIVLQTKLTRRDIIVDPRVIRFANTANDENRLKEELMNGLLEKVSLLTEQLSLLKTENTELHKKLEDKNKKLAGLHNEVLRQDERISEPAKEIKEGRMK